MIYVINNRYSGLPQFSAEIDCEEEALEAVKLGKAVFAAIGLGTDLSEANLSWADLPGANLSGTNLSWADLYRANLPGANLYRANLSRADLYGTNLSWTDLSGANLSGANLLGANLSWANLYGASYKGIPVTRNPVQVSGLSGHGWIVTIFDAHIKIGCRLHSIAEWSSFSDEAISKMHADALNWWNANKDAIFAVAKAAGRQV